MGLFDLAAPWLDWSDRLLAGALPLSGRLAVWAIVGSLLSMGIYRLTSPQRRLPVLKDEIAALRARIRGYDGDLAGLRPLLLKSIGLSSLQFALVLVPSILSSIPLLFLLVWLSNAHSYMLPKPGQTVSVRISPTDAPVRWDPPAAARRDGNVWRVTWPEPDGRVTLRDGTSVQLLALPFDRAVPVVHKQLWWNALIGNPLGYLPARGRVESVEIGLRAQQLFRVEPTWLTGWEALFFVVVVVSSLAIKFSFRIH